MLGTYPTIGMGEGEPDVTLVDLACHDFVRPIVLNDAFGEGNVPINKFTYKCNQFVSE